MLSILDQVARTRQAFRPRDYSEFLALQLARALNDTSRARAYAALAERFSQPDLISAFGVVAKFPDGELPSLEQIEQALEARGRTGGSTQAGLLLSIKIERRMVAVALYQGAQLLHLQQRSLSYIEADAIKGAAGFLAWILDAFHPATAVVEEGPESNTRKAIVVEAVRAALRDAGIPVWEIPRTQLLEAFGEPKCRTLQEVRRLMAALWPDLENNGERTALIDAAALGAFAQIQRELRAAREKEAGWRE